METIEELDKELNELMSWAKSKGYSILDDGFAYGIEIGKIIGKIEILKQMRK